jgi:hypothetical protein
MKFLASRAVVLHNVYTRRLASAASYGGPAWMPMTSSLSPLFVKQLKQAGKMIRFSILPIQGGWELLEESDSEILRQVRVSDWHRVERARDMFSMKASSLLDNGWVEVV